MRADVAERAGAGLRLVEPPHEREVGIGNPVLQVGAAEMADRADASCLDQLLREHHRGNAAVVVAEHVDDTGGVHRFDHRLRFRDRVGERLLAEHRLAIARGLDGDLGVRDRRAC